MLYAPSSHLLTLVATVGLYCYLGSSSAAATSSSGVDLRSLCSNKGSVDLTRSSQIRSLASELRGESSSEEDGGDPGCPERVRSALVDLDQLLSTIGSNVCSLEAVEKIREYYEAYISSSEESGNKHERPLPRALKNFVLAYGLRVSKLCKKNMINSLTLDTKTLLKDEDHKLIAPWTDERSLISQLMSEPSDYDDLLLPRDLSRVIQDADASSSGTSAERKTEKGSDDNKLYIQTATSQVIKKMKTICARRFRPIYEQLILPLIYLSNTGFNYQGEELERELKEMNANKDIHQWYRIVYLCEPLQDIEIVEDPRDAETTRGTDMSLVRILSREEAAKIRAEFDATPQAAEEEAQLASIKQLVYEQDYDLRLEDQVVDSSDASLMKLVRKFDTHKSDLQRIRSKLVKKVAKFLVNKIKHGQFNIVSSLLGGKTTATASTGSGQDGHEVVQSANNEIVAALDEYVGRSTSPDSSVAGFGGQSLGVAKRYYHQAATDGVSGITGAVAKGAGKFNPGKWFGYGLAIILLVVGIALSCG